MATAGVVTAIVGALVHLDQKRQKYLARTTSEAQNCFTQDELTLFGSWFASGTRAGVTRRVGIVEFRVDASSTPVSARRRAHSHQRSRWSNE